MTLQNEIHSSFDLKDVKSPPHPAVSGSFPINSRIDTPAIQYLIHAGIIVLAAALRLFRLGEWSFGIDEMYTLRDAAIAGEQLSQWSLRLPRLSLLLVDFVTDTLQISEWSARLASASIGTLSIGIVYWLTQKLYGTRVGLIAAATLAVSTWHIDWSQNARFYTMLMVLYFGAAFCFFRGFTRKHALYLLLSVLLLTLATGERLTAMFLVPVAICFVGLRNTRPFASTNNLTLRHVGLLLLPVIAFAAYDLVMLFATGFSYTANFIDVVVGWSSAGPFRLGSSIAYQIGLPIVGFGLLGGIRLLARRDESGLFISLNAVLPILLLVAISPFVFTVSRYAFLTLPFWIILSAVGMNEVLESFQEHRVAIAIGVVGIFFMLIASQNLLYYEYQNGNRSDWKGATDAIAARVEDDDQIYSVRPEIPTFYLDREVRLLSELVGNTGTLNGNTAWFFIDTVSGYVDPELYQWIRANSELVDVRQVVIPGKDLSIRIYRYQN